MTEQTSGPVPGEVGPSAGSPALPAGPPRPAYLDPWFIAGAAVGVAALVYVATRSAGGCRACAERRAAEAAPVDLPEPSRRPARPQRVPDAQPPPTNGHAASTASAAPGVVYRADPGEPSCEVEWCGLIPDHNGVHQRFVTHIPITTTRDEPDVAPVDPALTPPLLGADDDDRVGADVEP